MNKVVQSSAIIDCLWYVEMIDKVARGLVLVVEIQKTR
jgi:hypothetical protein